MHSAILAIALPPDSQVERARWSNFSAAIPKVRDNPAVREISHNVWQIDFHKSPAALGQLIVACEQFGYGYGILPFDGEPQWLDQPGEHLVAKTGWKIETSG